MGDLQTEGGREGRLPRLLHEQDRGPAAVDPGQDLGGGLNQARGHSPGRVIGQHHADGPTQREIYDPQLRVVVSIVLAASAWLGVATFLGMRYTGAGLVVSLFYAVSTFLLSLSPIKGYVINTAAMLSRLTRGRRLHRVMQCEPVDTAVYRNRPLARAVEPRTPLTIMIPIYDEPFDLIRRTSLETAIREVEDYGPLANLIVSDDGLMVFSDNSLPEFEAAARAKLEAQRIRSEREVIMRLDYYGEPSAAPTSASASWPGPRPCSAGPRPSGLAPSRRPAT